MAFPGTYNFRYYRGDTFEFIIRPKDGSGNAFPLDTYLDGATFTIANQRGPGGIRYAGLAEVDVANDIITCTITPTVGEDLTPGVTWFYDIEVRDAFTVYTFLTGTITVENDVTQPSDIEES